MPLPKYRWLWISKREHRAHSVC